MWTWNVLSGRLLDSAGELAGLGYSGHMQGVNNPDDEQIPDVGPVPRGQWTIGDFFDDPGGKGPIVAHLVPKDGTNTFGRSGFMIHGDNLTHNASLGCIILPHGVRTRLAASSDRDLQVV